MKKTKIVATVSESICQVEFLKKLIDAGVNVFRINTAHQPLDKTLEVLKTIRSVSEQVAILIDTKGPEIRTRLVSQPIEVSKDEILYMTGNDELEMTDKLVHVSYRNFQKEVKTGIKIFIDDGDVALTVMETFPDKLIVQANNAGFIKDKKSVNVPGCSFRLEALTEKDKAFILFAIENDIDFIAHSFVRSKEDMIAIQQILDAHSSEIKIIAKIENQEGMDNIDEILDHAYGIMVARGDLSIEIDTEKIPRIQLQLIDKCIESKKPVIVATQMLQSMMEHPRPTRAEVSDIANAVFSGTDAVMLSGETASGNFPLESVQMMAKIAEANEANIAPDYSRKLVRIDNEVTAALARSTVRLTTILPIKAVFIDTLSGRTARYLSAFRGGIPVYAQCYSKKVMRELALSYGIIPFYGEKPVSRDEFMKTIPAILMKEGYKKEDYIVVLAGSFGDANGASFLEVCKIENLIS